MCNNSVFDFDLALLIYYLLLSPSNHLYIYITSWNKQIFHGNINPLNLLSCIFQSKILCRRHSPELKSHTFKTPWYRTLDIAFENETVLKIASKVYYLLRARRQRNAKTTKVNISARSLQNTKYYHFTWFVVFFKELVSRWKLPFFQGRLPAAIQKNVYVYMQVIFCIAFNSESLFFSVPCFHYLDIK